MQRTGADPENMKASDFLCDFCGKEWDGESPRASRGTAAA
jgi:hypothetical protein